MPYLEDPPARGSSLVDFYHWALRFTQEAGQVVYHTFLGVVSGFPHFLRLKFTARYFHAVGGESAAEV